MQTGEDSKVGPDVTGKSESEERDGNSRLHASIRNGKCVFVESDIEVMERGNVKGESKREEEED